MAGTSCEIYINNSSVGLTDTSKTFEIIETGLKVNGSVMWTYSGAKVFRGFASSQGASSPVAGLEVGKTLTVCDVAVLLGQSYEEIRIYSVEGAPNRTISLENLYEFKYKLDEVKQDKLVSGTNIKTINNQSILGSGNISIPADTNTWRPIKIDSTEVKSSDVSSGALYFLNDSTSIVKISYSGGGFRLSNNVVSMWTDSTSNCTYLYSQDSMGLNGHLLIADSRSTYPSVHPTNSTGLTEPKAYMYGTGITVQDGGNSGGADIALSYPSQGGVLGLQIDIDDLTQANS